MRSFVSRLKKRSSKLASGPYYKSRQRKGPTVSAGSSSNVYCYFWRCGSCHSSICTSQYCGASQMVFHERTVNSRRSLRASLQDWPAFSNALLGALQCQPMFWWPKHYWSSLPLDCLSIQWSWQQRLRCLAALQLDEWCCEVEWAIAIGENQDLFTWSW